MTIYELQYRFQQEVAKYGIIHPVPSHTIEDFINYAYQNYITEKYDSLINPVEKFEVTERISRILEPLLTDHTDTSFTSVTTNSDYGYYVSKPTDLQYLVKESAKISVTDCNGDTVIKRCKVIPIKHNMIESNSDNPFLKPADNEIWRVNYANRLELILYEGATPSSYTFRYIKKHTPVSFNPVAPETGEMEIDSSVHEEIVLRAVIMYLSDQRNKQDNEKKKNNQE